MAGDFGTPRACRHDALYTAAFRTSIARMFISLGVVDATVDTIMVEQGYNDPLALSHLDKKDIEQLITTLRKPS